MPRSLRTLPPMAKPRYFHIHFQLLNITHTYIHITIIYSLTHRRSPSQRWRIYSKWDIFMCIWQCQQKESAKRKRETEEGGLGVEHFECTAVVVVVAVIIIVVGRHYVMRQARQISSMPGWHTKPQAKELQEQLGDGHEVLLHGELCALWLLVWAFGHLPRRAKLELKCQIFLGNQPLLLPRSKSAI